MNIKTINLTGTETAVKVGGGNAEIRNNGTATIYAASNSGIVAGADGVVSIPAGTSVTVTDTRGTVYILGTGSVEVVGKDWVAPVFKTAAAAGGEAEDTVARNAIEAHEGNTAVHVPAGGSSGQILGIGADGSAAWGTHSGIDVGQNTAGKTYTVDDVEYTGHSTCEIFNASNNIAADSYSHAEGFKTKALKRYSHAEGYDTTASVICSHAEGRITTASGDYSHAEGYNTTASGNYSHAEGSSTTASGNYSHAEGRITTASGDYSHAEGSSTTASGNYSHAEGYNTTASGDYSHAEGKNTNASNWASHAGGKYNKAMTTGATDTANVGDVFVIGNGTAANALSNAFRVTYSGAVYGLSAFNSSGADYAEFIKPWFDGNPESEDRVGYFVTVKDGLLHKANEGDYIVGITSGNPSVVGNADEDYYWRYARDEFNRFIYEDIEEEIPQTNKNGEITIDENGNIVMVKTGNIIKNARYKLSESYDPTKQNSYIERKNRPEWSYVGMVGIIPVRDDGSCEAGGFCKCGQNGIATRAETRGFDTFFVLGRISDSVVSVELR